MILSILIYLITKILNHISYSLYYFYNKLSPNISKMACQLRKNQLPNLGFKEVTLMNENEDKMYTIDL